MILFNAQFDTRARCTCALSYVSSHTHAHTYRQGVLLPTELQSLPLLLARLGRTHSLFSHPHPLSKSQGHTSPPGPLLPTSDSDESIGAVVSLDDFHSSFLRYCISNGFASLMYHYLDYYR